MKKTTVWPLLVAISVCGLAAAQSQELGPRSYTANLRLRPYVSLRGVYDSNLDATPDNELDDLSAILEAGMDFVNDTGLCTIDGRVWVLAEEYLDYTERAHQDFGNRLRIRLWEREMLLILLDQRYEDRTASDVVTGSIEGRKQTEASLLLGKRLTDKLDGDLAYRYRDVRYESERIFDWDQQTLDFTLGHDLTRRTVGTLLLRGGRQTSEGNFENADFGVAHVGITTRNSPKFSATVGLGWHYHDIEDAISTPSGDIAVRWQPRDRLGIDLTALRTVEPARQNRDNYNTVTRTSLALHFKPVNDITVSLTGMYARNDYDRPVEINGVDRKKRDDTWTGMLRCAYRPGGGKLELFGDLKIEERDSTLDANDYASHVVGVGARLQY
jgi:hypothetical protein